MLRQKGSIVFSFSPWAIQNWNDLWEDFGTRLLAALSDAKVPFDGSWKKVAKDSTKWLESSGLGQIGKAAAAVFGREKLYDAAFGALERWLRYDGAQVRLIREKLREQRLVVLIDDLDRCAPDLLPQLLLSLRELLDLPGFTFVLAFDDEIVSRALTQVNPAWAEGSNFLEKILDFRFHLPPMTVAQKERFVSRSMARYCPFVPKESAEEVRDLLPDNPRKLKALIRSLAAIRPQIARHDVDELNWVDMWLAQMLRLESYTFFQRLLKDDTLEKEAGQTYRWTKALSGKEGENEAENIQKLRELIKDSGTNDSAVVERLILLIEAARSRSSPKFRYMCELAIRPHAVTWKEFRSLYAAWIADRQASVLANWIGQHAVLRGVSADDVEGELFEAMLMRRNECLSGAAESGSRLEHESHIQEARTLLEMLEQYLLGLGKLGGSQFRRLYGQAMYWIGFRKNASDKQLREQEDTFLSKLLASSSKVHATELLEVVIPENWYEEMQPGVGEFKQALRRKCMAIIGPTAARESITFITRDGGIRNLTERGRFSAVKYCLFQPDSPVWTSSLRDELFYLIRKGLEDFVTYSNVCDLFQLLVRGLEYGIDSIGRQDIATLLSNKTFVRCLWDTVVSRGIQYRMQIEFIRARQAFIRNGAPEEAMPLTEELKVRLEEESARTRPATASNTG